MERPLSRSDEEVASVSTGNTARPSLIPVLKARRTSRANNSETLVANTTRRGSKQKHNNSAVEPSTSQESLVNSSGRSTYRQKLRSPKSRRDNLNKGQIEISRSRSRTSTDHQEGNNTRKRSTEKYKTRNSLHLRSLSTSESSTSSTTDQQVTHKYPLRNRLSSSSAVLSNNRVSAQDYKIKESVALGASTSHQATREEQEPSRLTRSGAVLRRSTRNSKGNTTIKMRKIEMEIMKKHAC